MKNVSDLPQTSDVTRNGPALSDRVRSLRLANRVAPGQGRPRAGWVPWVLCAGLLVMVIAFGYRAYRVAPAAPGDDTPSPTVEKPVAAPTATVASSGEVTLESKGYVVPLHQIQVGPNKVSGILKW